MNKKLIWVLEYEGNLYIIGEVVYYLLQNAKS